MARSTQPFHAGLSGGGATAAEGLAGVLKLVPEPAAAIDLQRPDFEPRWFDKAYSS
ncbi:hypothetical protein [Candidatus Spongiihabitans sp.]|uniref:hypothetical protein n=1 Tax=Candidatus Spongiihabitans sp. TaxID=3101308 RepID=UPI003C7CDC54